MAERKGSAGKNERTVNFLKAMLFDKPEWIPCAPSILPATWMKYGEDVEEIVLKHPKLFPNYKPGQFKKVSMARNYRKGRFTDVWGVVWDNIVEGLAAIPIESEAPLRDWSAFDTYQPPDPLAVDTYGEPIDWKKRREGVQRSKENGALPSGNLTHGFMYMRLFYLRGFTNFMMDVATREPRLAQLIEMVRDYNLAIVDNWVECGIEMLSAGDDLGLQTSLPMSPDDWRRYIKPSYMEIFAPCRDRGIYSRLHSDGHILEIIPDLIECGIRIINPQIRANTLEGLTKIAKGKVCIDLDLDRQLFPFASPAELRAHVHEAVATLNSPEGGLMIHAEFAQDVPPQNIDAVLDALEEVGCGLR